MKQHAKPKPKPKPARLRPPPAPANSTQMIMHQYNAGLAKSGGAKKTVRVRGGRI
jgi:hypothetical protein